MYSTQSIEMASLTEHPTRSHDSRPLDQEPTGLRSHTSRKGWWSAALLLVGLTLALAGDALGAPIQVTTTEPFSQTECTLKNAVSAVNAGATRGFCQWSGDREIELEAGTYDTNGALPLTINLGVDAVIRGIGGTTTATIRREATDPTGRFFKVKGTLRLSNVTLTGGASGAGGAINLFQGGSLTLSTCRMIGNSATDKGGAIHSRGTLSVFNCTFDGNSAGYRGGAIYGGSLGTISIRQSTFVDNSSGGDGGAIAIYSSTNPQVDLDIQNSTFSRNDADWGGALAVVRGSADVDMSTFKDNTSMTYGSAVAVVQASNAKATLKRSALAGCDDCVVAIPALCVGPVVSHGDNAAEDASCNLNQPGDQVVADLMLSDTLLAHGGLTQAHVPLFGSPLLDAYLCDASAGFYDQRGAFPRYPAAPSDPGSFANYGQDETCDIGAYESICNAGKAFGATFAIPVYESQVSALFGEVLNNGSCSSDEVDFGGHTSGCSIQWLRWGGTLEFQNIWFLEPACLATHLASGGDCFSDPEACKNACAIDSTDATVLPSGLTFPAQTLPSHSYRIDVPGCASTAGSLRYVIEFASGAFEYWDPEIDIINP